MPFTFRSIQAGLSKFNQFVALTLTLLLLASVAAVFAQETRSTIFGTVQDTSGAVVPGATVTVTNTETNASTPVVTGEGGTFEVPYLLPGPYSVSATANGFKKFVQQGIALTVGSRTNVDINMEVGAVTEEVIVTSDGPLLETSTASASSSISNREVMTLPVFGNSALLLARSVPGIQWTGQPNYLGQHSNVGASGVNAAGGVGGNEFSLDGAPNAGPSRRAASLPFTDTIAEIKVETAAFDASKGHTSGATISAFTKPGTNDFHGTLTFNHWQQRFNATQSTTNAAYFGRIVDAELSGNFAEAERLRGTERQNSGRSHNYAGTIGGPLYLPRFGEGGPGFLSGKDKLFFFFSYSAVRDAKSEEPTAVLRTVPTLAQRRGDFSALRALDPTRYTVYDPRTARVEGGRVVRDPFPNNQVPILNPLYQYYINLFPLPNVPGGADGSNNYLASGTPFNWDYDAYTNRIDWNVSQKYRVFGRWSWNDFIEDRGDFTYETRRGLQSNGLNRRNWGITIDNVYTINPTTIFNVAVAFNRFREGDILNQVQLSNSPGQVGLPSYLDDKAGEFRLLPRLDFSAYSSIGRGYPGFTHYSVGSLRPEVSKFIGNHSVKIGGEGRLNYRAFGSPGNTSGQFTFRNDFVRQRDNTNNAGGLGLEFAAFLLGTPTGISVDTNDTGYLSNRSYAGYIHDDWRASPKLTLNLGLRYEIEGGFRERYNRGLGEFDPTIELPISAAAEAAYARNPLPEVPANQFNVIGGARYLGLNRTPETLNEAKGAFMPRLGFAYQLNTKTVLRAGYGLFYDTNNVLNEGINQFGYSRGTGTTLTNNRGLTFENTNLNSAGCRSVSALTPSTGGNCTTIITDPFPVRADGTRFNTPFGNALEESASSGRGLTFVPRDWERARQQRWRVGIQRELGKNMVLEVAYLGSYSDDISLTKRLDVLPEQYFAIGLVRNNALADELNRTVTNPFAIVNFESLRTQNPTVYQDISTNGFFTDATIRKNRLLRPFPQVNGLNNSRVPDGENKYHHMEVSLQKRFSQGLSYTASYTWASSSERNFYENEFDEKPIWRVNSDYRPHHIMANGIYELPFGKGKQFFADNGIGSKLLGGWKISGIYHYQTGRTYGLPNAFFFGDDLRALERKSEDRTTEDWFNWQLFPGAGRDYSADKPGPYRERLRQLVPAQFLPVRSNGTQVTYENAEPADFRPADFHRRVFPSQLNWLRGDIMTQLDANIARGFSLTENVRMELRADFINIANNVQWDNPNTDIGSSNFGRVTNQYNTPRWIQFQFRLEF